MREQSGIHGPKLNNNQTRTEKLRNLDRPNQDHFYKIGPFLPESNISRTLGQISRFSDQVRTKKIGNLGPVRTRTPPLLILHPYITSGDIRRTLRNTISHFMERFMVFKLLKTVIRKFRNQRTCSGGRF